jgi:hypothetical protein
MLADQTRSKLVEYRDTLADAYKANPGSEKIVLAAGELKRAAKLEWSLENLEEAPRRLKLGQQNFKIVPSSI